MKKASGLGFQRDRCVFVLCLGKVALLKGVLMDAATNILKKSINSYFKYFKSQNNLQDL